MNTSRTSLILSEFKYLPGAINFILFIAFECIASLIGGLLKNAGALLGLSTSKYAPFGRLLVNTKKSEKSNTFLTALREIV